ncbi:glycosyltransferase family 2 protein [Peribacillus simplex]|uniref:glycosyltransferase family 2 protein n=1 Tax=Peribacillus simplex TaxID=1478 RepID=UPI0011A02C60|nr:glycosyltransferase family 2 protein [Peribacillus simplex]
MNTKVSIIVPIFKAEKWLSRCVDSIREQSYTDLEIILVNDGSPDKCGEICDRYAEIDNRIKVFHKNNEGTSAARNDGLKISTGKYIQFVDSDDWIDNNMCELLVKNLIESNSELVVCGLKVTKNNVELRRPFLPYMKLKVKNNIEDFFLLRRIFSSPCNKLYKKDCINAQFNTNSSLGEDLMFNLNYLQNIENTIVIEECLYNVCLDNNESLNRKFRENRLDIVIGLVDKEMEFIINTFGEDCDKTEIYNSYILGVHAFFRDIVRFNYKSKQEFLNIVNKYANNKTIENATKHSKMDRLDYKIFNYLIKNKNKTLIYYYFKLKNLRRIN